MRLTNFNASVDFSLSDLFKKNKDKKTSGSFPECRIAQHMQGNNEMFLQVGTASQISRMAPEHTVEVLSMVILSSMCHGL